MNRTVHQAVYYHGSLAYGKQSLLVVLLVACPTSQAGPEGLLVGTSGTACRKLQKAGPQVLLVCLSACGIRISRQAVPQVLLVGSSEVYKQKSKQAVGQVLLVLRPPDSQDLRHCLSGDLQTSRT